MLFEIAPASLTRFRFPLDGADALCSMTSSEKEVVWTYRYYLAKHMPNSLSKVMLSVSWNVRESVLEAHRSIALIFKTIEVLIL